ncbi:MAG: GrpB family protein, partial [Pseudomonadota bacterium]
PGAVCRRAHSFSNYARGISLDDFDHFGSTAIPNLIAKPIIDMMTPVAHMDDARRCVLKLQDLGYHRVETDFAKRVLFRRDDGATGLAYHLHFALCPAWPVKNELLFRDWLRDHTDVAAEYAELKRRLAGESHGDVVRYTYGKSAFIRRVICDARAAAGLPAETDWSE